MNAALTTFTAAQIANALGKTPQVVRRQLRGIAPGAVKIVSGNETAAWTFLQLPLNLRAKLEHKAAKLKYQSVESMLSAPPKQWQPAIPLHKLSDRDIQIATKLRDALKPILIQQHDPNLAGAQLENLGVENYTRVFGNRITARYWRELFMRTLRRDNGAEDFNRLETYLPDRVKEKNPAPKNLSDHLANDFAELESFISSFSDPRTPKKIEVAGVWTLAFEKVAALVRGDVSEKSAARRIRQFLFTRLPSLAASQNALLKMFHRKFEAFKNSNGDCKVLRDRREDNGARFELPEMDRDLLIHRAVFVYRGDIAPAWRDLLRKGFSDSVLARYRGSAANKSHVPASIMNSIAAEVETLTVLYQGTRAFDSIKGFVSRSYEGFHSLDCMQADDFTLNSYFYIPDGKGWFTLTRGQTILFIDFRSSRILGYALEPRASYSSLTIRSLCTHVFGQFGVPRVLYFERGIWKNSNLLKGKTDPFDFTEISQGLREFGVTFKHAIRPRSKTIERIGGIFQDMAEAEPGYCGRDERRDAPELLRKQMAEVATKKAHPSKYFYSYDQWNARIAEIATRYNAEPQQGKILNGLSPEKGFEKFLNHENPPVQFNRETRYLLATDKRVTRVTLNGVTVQVGKQKFNYRGREIAHLTGQDALIFFDPENPEVATITGLESQKSDLCYAFTRAKRIGKFSKS